MIKSMPLLTILLLYSIFTYFYKLKNMFKNLLFWLLIGIALTSLFNHFESKEQNNRIHYSEFISNVKNGSVVKVSIQGSQIKGVDDSGNDFVTYSPGDLGLMGDLIDNRVDVEALPPEKDGFLKQLFISLAPILLILGILLYSLKGSGGAMGGKNPLSMGRSKAKLINVGDSDISFDSVAGIDEAKEEVSEIVEFLKNPKKFEAIGGRIPRGVLMAGPPGTGKTLLAKAIAGEAKVPFFFISGSDFVEMFVGVGASRVRDMFEQAKKQSPCIIFIDEIDAVGRQRGAGMGGGNDEREQTLNQLLVEMDGFTHNDGVIVVAATNRPDVLDPALLRPGRFDRQVMVGLPDIKGRDEILKVHMRPLPIAKNVKSIDIARGTPGFSGADLANLVNEAALIAAKLNKKIVGMFDLESAKDKIMMGSERKTMIMDESEKTLTAYHESGHAIVGRLVPEHDPVYKVSIIPRGMALGVTMFLPTKDNYSVSKLKLNSQIASLFGGRIAEKIIYGDDKITTGASNDIKRATELAHKMVKLWGLSDKMGPIAYGEEESEIFLGRQVTKHKHISEETFKEIDVEVRKIIDANYNSAYKILNKNIDILHAMKDALIEYETIDKKQIDDLMDRQPMRDSTTIVDSDEYSKELGKSSVEEKDDDKQKGKFNPNTRKGKFA